jgi:ADP-heptose:LPS heptosyltransferase
VNRIKLKKEHIRRILLSRLRFINDVILTTPLIRRLKEALPEAKLSYFTRHFCAAVLHNPYLEGDSLSAARQL